MANQPTEWSNGLGYDLAADNGTWEFWKPGSTPNNCWIANFYPTGEPVAALHGRGVNMADAMRNAKPTRKEIEQ